MEVKKAGPLQDVTNSNFSGSDRVKDGSSCKSKKRKVFRAKLRECEEGGEKNKLTGVFFQLPHEVFVLISTFLPRSCLYKLGEEQILRALDCDTFYKISFTKEEFRVYYDSESLVHHTKTTLGALESVQIYIQERCDRLTFPTWLLKYFEENERVETFTLHTTHLLGDNVLQLADFVSNTKKLKSLVVGFDYLLVDEVDDNDDDASLDDAYRPLFAAIKKCKTLESLVLRNQEYTDLPLGGSDEDFYCHEELDDANLSSLFVQQHYIEAQNMISMISALKKEEPVSLSLELLCCEISDCGAQVLADFLGWGCPLFSLDLSCCGMSEDSQAVVLGNVPFSRCLHFLCMMQTGLTLESFFKILAAMVFCTCPLVYLNLQACALPPGSKFILPKAIANSQTLTFINLEGLELGDIGGCELAAALQHSKEYSLKYLKLDHNGFTAKTAFAFAEVWKRKSTLALLSLSFHEIKDEGGSALVQAMKNSLQTKLLFDIYFEATTIFQRALSTQELSIGDIFFNRYDAKVVADARAFLCYDVSTGASEVHDNIL